MRSATARPEEIDAGPARLAVVGDPEPLVDEASRSPQEPPVAAAPSPAPAAETTAADRIRELESALEKARETETQLVREFRNYRRHAEAELARATTKTRVELLAELGDTVQALELASGAANQDPAAVRDGIALVARSLQKVFERHGLARIPAQGVPFDPSLHEAVLTENVEGAARGTVVREVSPGFRTEEHVIRPAKVSVAA